MKLRITIQGKAYDVDVEVLDGDTATATAPAPAPAKPQAASPAAGGEPCVSPIAGTVTQVPIAPGDTVARNQVLLVMEAMKMETNIPSPCDGVVKTVHAAVGDAVKQGDVLVEFE